MPAAASPESRPPVAAAIWSVEAVSHFRHVKGSVWLDWGLAGEHVSQLIGVRAFQRSSIECAWAAFEQLADVRYGCPSGRSLSSRAARPPKAMDTDSPDGVGTKRGGSQLACMRPCIDAGLL